MICCHVQDAWQEWDWEEDLWDEGSEWDEYITVKETTSEGESGGDGDGQIFFGRVDEEHISTYINIYQILIAYNMALIDTHSVYNMLLIVYIICYS